MEIGRRLPDELAPGTNELSLEETQEELAFAIWFFDDTKNHIGKNTAH